MDAHAILAVIRDLQNGPSEREFTTSPISDSFFLSKSYLGEPCFGVVFPPGFSLPGSRETQGMSLEFYPDFELRGASTSELCRVGLIRCRDGQLTYHFAVMVHGYLAAAKHPVYPAHLLEYIEDWQDLFNKGRQLSRQEEIGLWGELDVILSAPDCNGMLEAWHGPKGSTFDFSTNNVDLDVKTSTVGHKHRFSLGQVLASPSGADRYVLSIYVTVDNAGGVTLTSLVNAVRAHIVDKVTLEKKLLAAGYTDAFTYGEPFSKVAVKMILAAAIPKVRLVDDGVTEVQFMADLSACPQATDSEVIDVMAKLSRTR